MNYIEKIHNGVIEEMQSTRQHCTDQLTWLKDINEFITRILPAFQRVFDLVDLDNEVQLYIFAHVIDVYLPWRADVMRTLEECFCSIDSDMILKLPLDQVASSRRFGYRLSDRETCVHLEIFCSATQQGSTHQFEEIGTKKVELEQDVYEVHCSDAPVEASNE